MEKKQSKHLVGSILCGVLTVFGIVASTISLIGGSNGLWLSADCIHIVLYIMIAYYAFAGYKKPHGNLLKYIILTLTILNLSGIPSLVGIGNIKLVILHAVEIGVLCYIAGRLAKAKENLILMILITVFEVIFFVSYTVLGIADIGVASPAVIWIDTCVAYFLRYKEHREAGLADAPKK